MRMIFLSVRNKHEALEHTLFISRAFNQACQKEKVSLNKNSLIISQSKRTGEQLKRLQTLPLEQK